MTLSRPDAQPHPAPVTAPVTAPVAAPAPDRCLLILGMHRSGTSALAGSFREAGLHMGRLLDQAIVHNPKGLQEPPAIVHMHENLLRENGGAWHDPPARIEWGPLHRAVRDLFIESRQGKGLWGFKEPRCLLVAQGWIDALPDWAGVGIFRDPRPVVRSIQLRNGFDLEKCFAIWTAYNTALLDLHRRFGLPFIEFHSDGAGMQAGIARLVAHAGLAPVADPAFFDGAIPRHGDAVDEMALPDTAARLLAALREAAW